MVHLFKWFNFVSLTKKLNFPFNTSLSIFILTEIFLPYLPYVGHANKLVYKILVLMILIWIMTFLGAGKRNELCILLSLEKYLKWNLVRAIRL